MQEGKEAKSGCKDKRPHGGSLGRPRRRPGASLLAPMSLRSPLRTAQVTPQSVPVSGDWSTYIPGPSVTAEELPGWGVDKLPGATGPPCRQGGGSRGQKADTEVQALAAGIRCAMGTCAHIW